MDKSVAYSKRNIQDTQSFITEEILLHEIREKEEIFAKHLMITSYSTLAFRIHSLKQKLTVVSYETTVALACHNLCNFVEHEVRL